MRKNIMILFAIVINFIFITNIGATIITCEYDAYKLVYDTDKYIDFVDYRTPYSYLSVYTTSDKEIAYTFYPEGESNKGKEYDIFISQLFMYAKPNSESECLKTIAYTKFNGNVNQPIKSELVGSGSSSSKKSNKVSCGNITDIPKKIPELTSMAITMIQIAVPVILVIMGSLDLLKGVTAQKEDEIKKGQQIFIKRLIVGSLIFFVIVIAKFLISIVADASSQNIIECVDCFLSGVKNCK